MATRPRILRSIIPPDEGEGTEAADLSDAERNGTEEEEIDADFDEATYLRAFPDIAEAVRRGVLESGLAHYRQTGWSEMRLEKPEYRALRAANAGPAAPHTAVDTLTISPSGSTLMIGWSDDRYDQLTEINLETRPEIRHNWTALPRLARPDVERTLDAGSGHRFGFLLVAAPVGGSGAPQIDPLAANAPVFHFSSGVETQLRRDPAVASDADLRDLALAALPVAAAGDVDPEAIHAILDQHVGVQIAAINRLIIEQARGRRESERFGPSLGRYRGSIITVHRGGADQLVPRLALVGGGAGAEAYEFIVVVTNADQFDGALRAARVAEATLGLSLTIVLQPEGDPAGTGEDSAADLARSDRLIFMDHAVLPRETDWAARHSAIMDDAPEARTKLMGGLLFHPDGSLANGGYYFEQETSLLTRPHDLPKRVTAVRLKSVTHTAAARDAPASRPVTGVPAAFLSVDRGWFETLGGFTRHYARAAHDDIDLCLRSLQRGVPPWIHPLPFWHFERRTPMRLEPSKGGAILNSWLLHRQWDALIVPDLLGPAPALFNAAPSAQAAAESERMRKVLLVSLGHPELVLGGSPVVCQELFDELRTRDGIECTMLAAVDREAGDVHQPRAGVTGFDGRDGVYLLHQTDHDYWLHRNNEPLVIDGFISLLRALRPDVVHFHHFMSVGLDLIGIVRRVLPDCRILLTFHEFAAICAADGHMVRRTDRSLCDRASPVRCHQCLPDRPADEFVIRKMWLDRHLDQVDHFTCPSHFMIEPYVRWGIARERISHVSNGQRSRVLRPLLPPPTGPRNRFGFFGLLHDDKGVTVLLRAVTLLREAGFNQFSVDINGGGIQHASPAVRREIEAFQEAELRLPPAERLVSFNGAYSLDQIQSRMARVDWTIVPSVWWEIFGLVISEAWMFGRPVICSNVGGMAERVTHEVDGLHFEMGDAAALAATIRRACTEDGLWERLHAAIPEPPSRAAMADGFLALYEAA